MRCSVMITVSCRYQVPVARVAGHVDLGWCTWCTVMIAGPSDVRMNSDDLVASGEGELRAVARRDVGGQGGGELVPLLEVERTV